MAAPVVLQTAYEILGVEQNASLAEIKRAYRALARVHHPDRVSHVDDVPRATAAFQRISRAYEILSDANVRQQYDAALELQQLQEQQRHMVLAQLAVLELQRQLFGMVIRSFAGSQ